MDKEKQEKSREQGPDALTEGFELLDKAESGQDITVRDDQYEYDWIEQAAGKCRKKGCRFRLIDTGRFEKIDLMWLIDAGLDLYTDDQTRKDYKELEELVINCRKNHSLLAYLQTENFGREESESSVFSGLKTLARNGVHLSVSCRQGQTDLEAVHDLAQSCLEGRTRLVYYHRGTAEPVLEDIGGQGAWIHITDKSIDEENLQTLLDTCRSARDKGGGLIVHLEEEKEFDLVEPLVDTKAYVLFLYAQFDYKSPFKELEQRVPKKDYDFRAYYLQHDFFI